MGPITTWHTTLDHLRAIAVHHSRFWSALSLHPGPPSEASAFKKNARLQQPRDGPLHSWISACSFSRSSALSRTRLVCWLAVDLFDHFIGERQQVENLILSDFAALRLITNSNPVGYTTGRSVGLVPSEHGQRTARPDDTPPRHPYQLGPISSSSGRASGGLVA
jgi:hypothetical protein